MENVLDFIDTDEVNELTEKQKVVIVDGHNLAFKTVYSALHSDPTDKEFRLWKHYMFNTIFSLIRNLNPDKLILAFDQKGSWRYDVYSEYKAHRANQRKKSVLDYEKFYEALNDFIDTVKDVFSNVYTLSVKRAEADDIIAVLAKHTFIHDEVVIVSNDSDMNQLICDNINQYDISKQKMFECLNPKRELELKILQGDSSDNIKGIKRGVGVKTAEKILKKGLDNFVAELQIDESEKDKIMENYKRNTILIDLDCIPNDVKNAIVNEYDHYDISGIKFSKVLKMFVRYGLNKLLEDWNNIAPLVKKLK